nr:OmpH family outer membrane protein [Sphingomonas bacterium]
MKTMLLAATLAVPAALGATAATAQVGGIAVADARAAVTNSAAYTTARSQIETTYKAQLDQAQARSQAIEAELRPLVTQFQTAQSAPNANQAALQTQYSAIQAKQQAGQAEIARITQPAQRAEAYTLEQIQAKLPEAVGNVVKTKNVSLLVSPQAVLFAQPTADITPAITVELNRLVPTVGITPPAGWQPGQQGQAAGAAPAAAAPAATSRRNSGR